MTSVLHSKSEAQIYKERKRVIHYALTTYSVLIRVLAVNTQYSLIFVKPGQTRYISRMWTLKTLRKVLKMKWRDLTHFSTYKSAGGWGVGGGREMHLPK